MSISNSDLKFLIETAISKIETNKFLQENLRSFIFLIPNSKKWLVIPFISTNKLLRGPISFSQNANFMITSTFKNNTLLNETKVSYITPSPRTRNYKIYFSVKDMTFLGKLLQEQVFNRINSLLKFQILSGIDAIRYLETISTGTDNEFVSDFTMIAYDGTIMDHCIVNNFTFNAHYNNGLFSDGEGTLRVQEIKLFEVIAQGKI